MSDEFPAEFGALYNLKKVLTWQCVEFMKIMLFLQAIFCTVIIAFFTETAIEKISSLQPM
jgi:hypothetical protein